MGRWWSWLIIVVFALGITFVADLGFNAYLQKILVDVAIGIILATSLNLVNGFCGQFSLGHAGFMAVGAYVSGVLSMNWQPFHDAMFFLNFPIYAIVAGLCAAFAGFLVGMPSLRLRGDYLAIVTLGFGEIIRVCLLNMQSVGGARGIPGVPGPSFFANSAMAYGWAGLTILVLWRIINSSHGRAFKSVREDEVAASCMGINITRTKVMAFVISSFFAGVAGSLFAHTNNYLNPSSFQFVKSVDVIIMVVLGGMGSLSGSVLAAVLVTILPEALRPLQGYTGVDLRMIIYSLVLIFLMILRPQGIFGSQEINEWFKERRKGWGHGGRRKLQT